MSLSLSVWAGWEGQGCDGGHSPLCLCPQGAMLLSLQAAYGTFEPLSAFSCAFFILQNSSPGVVPTQKLLPALGNRYMGQGGMKLGVAESSQKELEVLLPPDVEL